MHMLSLLEYKDTTRMLIGLAEDEAARLPSNYVRRVVNFNESKALLMTQMEELRGNSVNPFS